MSFSGSATSVTRPSRPVLLVAALVVLAAFAAAALWFALHQAVWVDETTQMFGVTLPLGELMQWLVGERTIPTGVPPDRAPPLSYLLGALWTLVVGHGEMQLRIVGILATLAGAPAIWMASRRMGSQLGALFALALVFLAPAIIVQSGEIRSYPLFFAFSCWALWAYTEILARPALSIRHLVLLSGALVLVVYTHFYGVVLGFCLLGSLFVFAIGYRRPWLPVIGAGVVVGILSAGIIPFIAGGMKLSTTGGDAGGANGAVAGTSLVEAVLGTARLAYRLVFHGTHLTLGTAVVVLAAACLGILALLALVAKFRSPLIFILAPLIVAFVTLPAVSLVVKQFDVLSPSYNLWMVPNAAIFLAGAFALEQRRVAKYFAWGAGAVVVLAHLAADATLLRNPEPWTHGPGEWVVAQLTDPSTALVIHEGGDTAWGHAFFPVTYLTSGAATQVLRGPEGDQLLTPTGLAPLPDGFSEESFGQVMVLRVQPINSETLAKLPPESEDCGFPAPELTPRDPAWQWQARHRCAFIGAEMLIADRP
jgi:4-amino-4-deoxy-L-arabinose transferase-like glycosyltransferase